MGLPAGIGHQVPSERKICMTPGRSSRVGPDPDPVGEAVRRRVARSASASADAVAPRPCRERAGTADAPEGEKGEEGGLGGHGSCSVARTDMGRTATAQETAPAIVPILGCGHGRFGDARSALRPSARSRSRMRLRACLGQRRRVAAAVEGVAGVDGPVGIVERGAGEGDEVGVAVVDRSASASSGVAMRPTAMVGMPASRTARASGTW